LHTTTDSLSRRQLLANLWARSAALQCSFNQESLDLFIVTYSGSIAPGEIFDPEMLSGVVVQVKFKIKADGKAGAALRPIGIPRDSSRPLPYLALLLELGNESAHKETNSKIEVKSQPAPAAAMFQTLVDHYVAAEKDLEDHRSKRPDACRKRKGKDPMEEKMRKVVLDVRNEMDNFNWYALSVRGATPEVYGILKEANVVKEFASLLSVTMPAPVAQDHMIQHMWPLKCLGDISAHTDWMYEYLVPAESTEDSGEELMDLDP
jgi:hypothetical protein